MCFSYARLKYATAERPDMRLAIRTVICAGLAAPLLCLAAPVRADTAAAQARATLSRCLKDLPADKLSDEKAIADCLARAENAARAEDGRQGQIEFQRRLDEMDRLIERTRRFPSRR